MHKPIVISDISLSFPDKMCFADFSCIIQPAARIAVIGRNGGGKSSLLKILTGLMQPSSGEISNTENLTISYVPQIITDRPSLSGGERFNKALTSALAQNPDVLLLDEPTNHLDARNRRALMQMLRFYAGTLIIVSHDRELLKNTAATLWHIDNGHINIFNGSYEDYLERQKIQRAAAQRELCLLDKEKTLAHKALMKEQARAAQSRKHGERLSKTGKWPPIIAGGKKRQAQNTAGAKYAGINERRAQVHEKLSSLYIPEIIKPKFSITSAQAQSGAIIIVQDGAAGYGGRPLLEGINFSLAGNERMAITGGNGSGKTTLLKALMRDGGVKTSGGWTLPKKEDIGYLDQHYANIDYDKTVFENIKRLMSAAAHAQIRDFLNDFLFRKQGEVNCSAATLSGGERARLSFALIAARTPKLLILDEITNNIDLETKDHLAQILKDFPAALIAVSHERGFLEEINITKYYDVEGRRAK
ncbi:MAG: ATP-binding cassette domain-containing protein [Elusimicrobiota bacterium]|jgi:ATPase subunit of ABC transporter with duplicated ATPase domains|nr:ATP-binding cassette domain-containing protein [Elusimicrobiota bacterium]